jgi:hypothetical protein
MSTEPLKTELGYFEKHRADFVERAPGKFVLIKGEEDYGFFDSAENAYKHGMELFGVDPFLIKEILPEDQIHEIPAHFLGLTHASL